MIAQIAIVSSFFIVESPFIVLSSLLYNNMYIECDFSNAKDEKKRRLPAKRQK